MQLNLSGNLRIHLSLAILVIASTLGPGSLLAQQTLGGIVGVVTDSTGGVIPNATVTATDEQTGQTRTVKSNGSGQYSLVNLPIGTYTITYDSPGFEAQKTPHIGVQAERTATVDAKLKVGSQSETVEVDATPLLNAVDTTNGYVLDSAQIESAPLPTGSFTGLAILATGVSAELSGGTGANSGMGNQPIWANGQRDTSNSFLLNGIDGANLFNGKSTSQVSSARVVNNTGVGNTSAGGVIQSSASVYLSIGNAIPTPAPETIQEVQVNASLYDASQGSTSGAHIQMTTKSGTNTPHGNLYIHRGTGWINAAPFFFNQDPDIPANQKVPQLHRYTAGGSLGGPILKDKLFGFIGYQHVHVSDQEIGYSFFSVPVGLTDDRSAAGLAAVSNNGWAKNGVTAGNITNSVGGGGLVALALMNEPSLPGEPGNYLVPNPVSVATVTHPYNVSIPGTGRFTADQLVSDLDFTPSSSDTLSLRYYYQHDPTVAPYGYSNVPGFAQHMDNGSQVFTINNTNVIGSSLSATENLGILREKIYSTNEQPFSPGSVGVNSLGSSYYSGVSIVDILGTNTPAGTQTLSIGPGSSQGSLTGVFQNRIMPSADAIWTKGKHTLSAGGSWAYTQLNNRDRRPGTAGTTTSADFSQFVQGLVTTNDAFQTTTFLQGNGNRYYRANQVGIYLQDKFQITSHLSLTAGLRYDWNGGLTEKYGRIFNFDPTLYNAGSADDPNNPNGTIANNGYVIARNSHDTTLTGRQWGMAPRVGFAYSPPALNNKLVIRGGFGIYYDRGELSAYFSPGYAAGEVLGGPFGVNQAPPFVNTQFCPLANITEYYNGYIPTCDPNVANLAYPWGKTLGPAPSGNASDINQFLPNAYQVMNGAIPFSMGVYDRKNTLPYSMDYTLDVQWQPRRDLAIEIGYVGNLDRHEVIPLPFNQPNIATPSNPIRGQNYTYGYTVVTPNFTPLNLPDGTPFLSTYEGGNNDLRVPYMGYSAEAEDYKTVGIGAYNALQVHVDKRMSHGFETSISYTFSHATDEQSALGLFYNGNNPNNVRSGYGLADFDRKHVLNFSYAYNLPNFYTGDTFKGKFTNGWSLTGITVLQSGQPFSVVDYSGAVGSIFYSVFDGITNPIVPLAPGCSAKSATTGASGAFGNPALKASCFTVPLLNPGDLGGAIPAGDVYETNFLASGQRNIFRQAPQRAADISLAKLTSFGDHGALRYTFDVFNVSNTTSFDVTGDNVTQNAFYNNFPVAGTPALPTNNCTSNPTGQNNGFYTCPAGLGITLHTIGSPRQIQMSLHYDF